MSSLLRIENLSVFHYSDTERVQILSDVSIHIGTSEVFGVVGESGCGKTMTALSVLRLLPPGMTVEGRVIIRPSESQEIDLLSLPESQLPGIRGKYIGMVFQEPMTSLNPVLSIGSQVSEPLIYHEGLSKKEAIKRAVELLRRVKIPEPEKVVRYYPHQLSGGMRQRVMIAIAISCSPLLLIADEPTTALDVTIQAEILRLLMELQESTGMSILLITHDLSIVAETCQRVAVMYAGRVVEEASVREIFTTPMHPYTRGLLQSLPLQRGKKLNPIPGVVPSPRELPRGCKFSTRCEYRVEECETREPSLQRIKDGHKVRCIRADRI